MAAFADTRGLLPDIDEWFTAVLGEKVVCRLLIHDEVRASGQPGALEIANMYQFYSALPTGAGEKAWTTV